MGPITKARKLTETLKTTKVDNQRDYEAWKRKVDAACRDLGAAWTNPAVELDAVRAKNELLDAWHTAMN